ncbi:MAG: hypothetical protein H6899_11685 [Rhodobacter sp.]|nr:hypothetical protein [Paracoccaceae bacterium]MCB1409798.1 hypothetical protein [Paracoccaceae bacterium]MCC0080588.1 hypothetical protein [Rhodobacter sp.]
MAGDGRLTVSRRGLLAAAAAATAALAGCSRLTHGALPPADPPAVSTDPALLRIVIFEIGGLDLPFHAGLVIHTPDGVSIFDPAGNWQPQAAQCTRDGDMLRQVTPQGEAAYLSREGLGEAPGHWVVHVFDRPVSAATARLALARAEAAPPVPPLHCALGVGTVLADLPGFDFIDPGWVTADLLQALLGRPGFTYARRDG